jgi:oxygen-independent coproporphyrinogen-3 oxidase
MSAPIPPRLALYIHIPFCPTRCIYCDFNAYAGAGYLRERYVAAVCRELEVWGYTWPRRPGREDPLPPAVPREGWRVRTIYLGGGTPSMLAPDQIATILDAARAAFAVEPDAEISMEVNPGTVDEAYFRSVRAAGVNRVSIGVQSFDDVRLKALSRVHTAAEARQAYAAAHAAGLTNVNIDLIFGLEGQDPAAWRWELEQALALQPRPVHLSLYGLTVEPRTPLEVFVRRGRVRLPDADAQAEMYELAEVVLDTHGYEHYEISNWCLPGYACRHNLVYWRNEPYLGVGCGAHSALAGRRWANLAPPRAYCEAIERHGHALDPAYEQEPDPALDLADTLILGLRTAAGVCLEQLQARHGPLPAQYVTAFDDLAAVGLLERSNSTVRLTRRGRLLANQVFIRLLPE